MKKKLLQILTFTVFLFCLFPFAGNAFIYGDTDGNGAVSAYDAREILRASVSLRSVPGEEFEAFDFDKNGFLSSSDARSALRVSVNLEKASYSPRDKGFSDISYDIVDTSEKKYTYEEMEKDLRELRQCFPSRFRFSSAGTTVDGRNIYCIVLGSGHAKNQIAVDAGIHGSEYLNPAAVMSAVEYCLRNYDTVTYNGKTVRELLYDTDIYIFPMLNPDGIAISQKGLKGLNKQENADRIYKIYTDNLSKGNTYDTLESYLLVWKANANGVDLNRNFSFPVSGRIYNTGVNAPANEEYAGNRQKPENETAAYVSVIESLRNPVAVLSIHSQGNLIYWDCSQSAEGRKAAKNLALTVNEATGYYLDMSDSFVGASADWTMIEKGIPSVTVECGKGHNPLPLNQQREISRKIQKLFLATAVIYDK